MRVCFSAVSGRAGFQTGNLMGHFPILGPAKLTERDDMMRRQKHGWLVAALAGAGPPPSGDGELPSHYGGSPRRTVRRPAPGATTPPQNEAPPPAQATQATPG